MQKLCNYLFLWYLVCFWPAAFAAQPELLEPEKAFRFSARVLDASILCHNRGQQSRIPRQGGPLMMAQNATKCNQEQSDEIVVMHQGKVVQQGPKSKVLSPPYPAYTELLLSSVPEMDPDWLTGLLAKRSMKAKTTA